MSNAKPIVAYQGEPGAYSEQAIRQYFGAEGAVPLPQYWFDGIFSVLDSGQARFGMLPVENSTAGTVIPAYDELLDHDMRVLGEEIVAINHCLVAPRGSRLADIRIARSHPEALAQCRLTLRRLGLTEEVMHSTAGSARLLAEEPTPGYAGISSQLAAEKYDLDILVHGCQDIALNYTRFFVMGLDPLPGATTGPMKTSITFTLSHTPGALYNVLGELATRGINLSKIESRPRRDRPWSYRFYADFSGHLEDDAVSAALTGVLRHTSSLRVLGSYAAATTPGAPERSDIAQS